MKTLLIAIAIGLALLVSVGGLATTSAQSTFAIGESGTSGSTNGRDAGSGGTSANAENGGITNSHLNPEPRLNQSQGQVNVAAASEQNANCGTSANTGSSANTC
jgi:hypothetical protein